MSRLTRLFCRHTAVLGCTAVLVAGGAFFTSAMANSGPFSGLRGRWSGTGVIRVRNDAKQTTQRVRCNATYRPNGSHDVDLRLACKSDSYKFDLTGNFEADARDRVTGRWSEQSYNIGGTAIGRARGNRLQIHAESSAFSAELRMVTHSRRQSVSLDSRGAGKRMTASVTLRRN